MLAIIPEDSKAGLQFWKAINRELLGSKAIMLDKLDKANNTLGYSTILPRLEKAVDIGIISQNWNVLIAMDYTGTLHMLGELDRIKNYCIDNKINILITTYHCIEEVFLSFDLLTEWVNNVNSDYLKFINYVGNCIKSGENYFSKHAGYEDIFEVILNKCKKDRNREQFASQLLMQVTQRNNGFKIIKGSLGICWVNNCCETETIVLKNSVNIKTYRRLCGIAGVDLTAKAKLELISERSVLGTKKVDIKYLEELL